MNLHNKRMQVVQTAPNGVVGSGTVFQFSQVGNIVEARYSGGRISTGFLVGILQGDMLSFRFSQISDGTHIDGGTSMGRLEILGDGRLRIIESFTWDSRGGEAGVNIFEEISDDGAEAVTGAKLRAGAQPTFTRPPIPIMLASAHPEPIVGLPPPSAAPGGHG